jgi:hypothetical protein
MPDNARSKHDPYWPRGLSRVQASRLLPSPPNDFGFNPKVGARAAPHAVNPKAGERKHVSAIVIFTKQFHPVTGRWFAV